MRKIITSEASHGWPVIWRWETAGEQLVRELQEEQRTTDALVRIPVEDLDEGFEVAVTKIV